MTTIDSFIGLPLFLSAAVAAILFIFLLVMRVRNTGKTSIIFFIDCITLLVGSLYTNYKEFYIYYVFTIILIGIITTPYLILKAFDNPQKREEKKASKKAAEIAASRDNDTVNKVVIQQMQEKTARMKQINKDLIAKLSTFFSSDNSMEKFLEYCNELVTEKVTSDGCVILIADDYDNTLAVKSFKGKFPPPYKLPEDLPHKPIRVETNFKFAQFPLQNNIFGDIFTSGESLLVGDSVKEPRIFQNGPEEFLRCGSYIFVPITQLENTVGVLALARTPDHEKYTNEEFEVAKGLADAISTAMKPLYSFLDYAEHTELNKDGSIASKYQKDLLPQKLPVLPGVSIGCYSNPIENVVGDYYDIIVSRKDRVSFILSDVAGKGMNSLIVMIMIRAILRLAVNTAQTAATILSWANRGICSDSSKIDRFASVALINYNTTTHEAEIATCGNNPVLVYSATENVVKQISIPSEPMGVMKDAVYQEQTIKLNPGDIIATCTDGLLESLNENGVQYSIESLKKVLMKNISANAKDISNRVKEDLKKYCGITQQYDDQSLLVIKIQ